MKSLNKFAVVAVQKGLDDVMCVGTLVQDGARKKNTRLQAGDFYPITRQKKKENAVAVYLKIISSTKMKCVPLFSSPPLPITLKL